MTDETGIETDSARARVETPATVTVGRRGARRLQGPHPWIYRSDLERVDAAGGDTVQVIGPRGRHHGWALYSDRSKIALRRLTSEPDPGPIVDLVHRRLAAALDYRDGLTLDADALRLVHSEGDLLPSVVVDRYGDCIVVQALSQGADRLLPEIVRALVERLGPRGVLARNDPRVRLFEGLEQRVEVLHGEIPESVIVRESDVRFEVNLREGQKTGLFLDQHENHLAAARYGRGRALDAFSYQGGFALHLARRCDEVVAIESSEAAAWRLRRNAELNELSVEIVVENVFDRLREFDRAGERFDTIVLDPPAFAKSKAAVANAVAGYKEINLRALKLLRPGGHLVTCSCSYHVDEELFTRVLGSAAADVRAPVTIVERRGQSRDHPVLIDVPETEYLKCFVLRRLE